MNVYDEAHSLAKAIKESNEFREFDRMRKAVDEDKESTEMLKEMQELQMQLQAAQLAGQEPDKDLFSRFQSLSTMVATKPLAAQYLQAQGAFMVTICASGSNAARARPVATQKRPPLAIKYSSALRFSSAKGGMGFPLCSAPLV